MSPGAKAAGILTGLAALGSAIYGGWKIFGSKEKHRNGPPGAPPPGSAPAIGPAIGPGVTHRGHPLRTLFMLPGSHDAAIQRDIGRLQEDIRRSKTGEPPVGGWVWVNCAPEIVIECDAAGFDVIALRAAPEFVEWRAKWGDRFWERPEWIGVFGNRYRRFDEGFLRAAPEYTTWVAQFGERFWERPEWRTQHGDEVAHRHGAVQSASAKTASHSAVADGTPESHTKAAQAHVTEARATGDPATAASHSAMAATHVAAATGTPASHTAAAHAHQAASAVTTGPTAAGHADAATSHAAAAAPASVSVSVTP